MENPLAGAMDRHPQATGAPVARIMYASKANIDGPIYTEMERIRASAMRHNMPARVATALEKLGRQASQAKTAQHR